MNADKIILILLSVGFLRAGWIEEYAQEAAAMNKACGAKEYVSCREHLLRLEGLLDGRVDIGYRLAKVEARLGNKDASLDRLSTYVNSGLTFADPASEDSFASFKTGPEFEKILARLKSAKEPVTASKLFLTLPQADLIAEDIAYDSDAGKFYVSGVRHSKILSIDKQGAVSEFVRESQPNLWAILALGVDSKRGILWAATAALPECLAFKKGDEGKSALLKYSLKTGALLKRYDLANDVKHALGDMIVGTNGDVFVSDGEGAVYWVDHKKDALEILVSKGTLRSPQTPALSPDGTRLFVPDYTRGIGIVDLATKQVKLLEHPKELSLGGIDGMYFVGQASGLSTGQAGGMPYLIAIQNGTEPERLIRMTLDDSLTRVVAWKTIEANWPGLGDPTHGVLVGDEFYFIANSGWDRMADDGSVKTGATFEPATIRYFTWKTMER